MIKIHCRTNVDCARSLQWPSELPDRPIVGDYIRSTSSTNNKYIEMRVASVTWVCKEYKNLFDTVVKVWELEVYLDIIPTRFQNIPDFERFVNT